MSKDIICNEKPKQTRKCLFNQEAKTLHIVFTSLALQKLENSLNMRMVICGPEMVRHNPSDMLVAQILKGVKRSKGLDSITITSMDLGSES